MSTPPPNVCHPIAALHQYRDHYEVELTCGHRTTERYPGTQTQLAVLVRWKDEKLARFCATCHREWREGKGK